MAEMLDYSFKVCLSMVQSREFRNQVLECLVKIYLSFKDPDYVSICQARCNKIVLEGCTSQDIRLLNWRDASLNTSVVLMFTMLITVLHFP